VLVRWCTGPGCPYCSGSAPYLTRWDETYRKQGLVVVGFYHHKSRAPLNRPDVIHLAGTLGFRFPLAVDPQWRTLRRWWLLNTPERQWTSVSFLIDKQGFIRYVHPGGVYSPEDAAHMEARIRELLEEKEV
jgi:peroxiredoxin